MNREVKNTREFVYNNIKLDETRNFVKNTLQEYERIYGSKCYRNVNVKCVAKSSDKVENETKNIKIERYNIIGEVDKIMQSSKGMCKFVRIISLKIIVEGIIYENVIFLYLKYENIAILWKKFS